MIESVQFKNFKVLRDATLLLSRFTLIVGPNGSGKSTVLQALQAASNPRQVNLRQIATAGLHQTSQRGSSATRTGFGPAGKALA